MELGFPGGASGKEPTCSGRRHETRGFNPWVGKIPGEGHGHPLSIVVWRIPLDRGAWQATVHTGTKSWTWLKQLSRHTHNLEISLQILFNDQGNSPAAIQSQAWSLMTCNSNNFHNSKCPRQMYSSVLVDVYIAERVILYVYQSFSYWGPQWSLRNVKSH